MTLEIKNETAVCRGCGKALIGKPYHLGGGAYHPKTMESCPVNQYGGYVCSYQCDKIASEQLEGSMPGAGNCKTLSVYAQQSLRRNWPKY